LYPVYIYSGYRDITSFKYYDGVNYTDYTAEAQSLATDDVPLGGNVGDCYLFGADPGLSIQENGVGFVIEKTSIPNNHEYVWEYYDGGVWVEPTSDHIWNNTDGLSQGGRVFLGVPHATPAAVIDGVNARWIRARITVAGGDSPVADRIRQHKCSGACNYRAKEQYTANFKVISQDGAPIENASIMGWDQNGVLLFSESTGGDGTIAEQIIDAKVYKFDLDAVGFIGETIFDNFSVKITAPGYREYSSTFELTEPVNDTVALKPVTEFIEVPIQATIESPNINIQVGTDPIEVEIQ